MAKKQRGHKKPIYKKWWFWIIVVFALIGFSGGEESDVEPTVPSEPPAVVSAEGTNMVEESTPTTIEVTEVSATEDHDDATVGEKNALRSALSYLNYSAFSYSGLIGQLEYEGYTTEEATYAVDNCGADWNEQALASAKNYLDYTAFSYTGLIGQLEYEGFTTEQATYAADNCGADWFEQAEKCAKNYLDYSGFSRQGLIDQLVYEGFTQDQAVYGVEQNGL